MSEKINVIYISASSYSGSTILGLILGCSEKIFNVGEADMYNEIKENIFKTNPLNNSNNKCTCSKNVKDCVFWKVILNKYNKDIDFNESPGFSVNNLKTLFKIQCKLFNPLRKDNLPIEYEKYLKVINAEAKKYKRNINYILDTSKSINTLNILNSNKNINLKVIHLTRNGVNVTNSFKKNGQKFFIGLFSWMLVNSYTRKYLKRFNIEHIHINYKKLCEDTENEFKKINKFLGINLGHNNYIEKIKNESYHVVTGSMFLNKIKNNEYDYTKGLNPSVKITHLNKKEQFFVKIFNFLMNKKYN